MEVSWNDGVYICGIKHLPTDHQWSMIVVNNDNQW